MPVLSHEKLIIAFHKLSLFMAEQGTNFDHLLQSSSHYNAWFTQQEVERAVSGLRNMLNNTDLEKWFSEIKINPNPKKIGLILAGNIPLVGFHDVISVLATGNIAMIKLSSSDDKLMPALLAELITIEPLLADRIQYVERLKDFDAITEKHKPGETIELVYSRKGLERTTKLTFIENPSLELLPIENTGGILTAEMKAFRDKWLESAIK
ncbi:MAG: hypothetical protein EOO88_28445 [Pedobacter sp.]|nr:MAG: hypothetical protein EOO88_28445 [Pedobacter sp.]